MKLTGAQINRFLQQPKYDQRVFLCYGPDVGLARERAKSIAAKLVKDLNDPFAVTSFQGAELGSDSAKLIDEAAAVPFGGGRKLIRILSAVEGNNGPLADFFKNPPAGDSVIVIEAGDLDSRSKLRSLCEKEAEIAVAIPCYVEDPQQRQSTIAQHFEVEGLRAARDVLSYLCDVLPPDRMAMRNELDKLVLYAHGQKEITKDDVLAIIADAGATELDDLIHAVCGGDAARTAILLDHFFSEQASGVMLLRSMQRHLMRLQLAQAWMEKDRLSPTEAIKKLSPPVFWKAQDPMKRQLARLSAERIEKRLEELLQAETALKRTGAPEQAIIGQLFLNMAAKP